MKRLVFFAVLLSSITAAAQSFHLRDEGLKGKVKTVVETKWIMDKESGRYEFVDSTISRFNSFGFITGFAVYSKSKVPGTMYAYTYEQDTLCVLKKWYWSEKLVDTTRYIYENGLKIVEKEYPFGVAGLQFNTILYKYNAGVPVTITSLKENGDTLSRREICYDKAGRKIKAHDYINFGKWQLFQVMAYSYQVSGLPASVVTTDASGKVVKEITYEYDQLGNKVVIREAENRRTSVIRYSYDYDKQGNWTGMVATQEFIDAAGKVTGQSRPERATRRIEYY
jgi:YD repeat-containing protein